MNDEYAPRITLIVLFWIMSLYAVWVLTSQRKNQDGQRADAEAEERAARSEQAQRRRKALPPLGAIPPVLDYSYRSSPRADAALARLGRDAARYHRIAEQTDPAWWQEDSLPADSATETLPAQSLSETLYQLGYRLGHLEGKLDALPKPKTDH
jgi:hypothetical protein